MPTVHVADDVRTPYARLQVSREVDAAQRLSRGGSGSGGTDDGAQSRSRAAKAVRDMRWLLWLEVAGTPPPCVEPLTPALTRALTFRLDQHLFSAQLTNVSGRRSRLRGESSPAQSAESERVSRYVGRRRRWRLGTVKAMSRTAPAFRCRMPPRPGV